MGLNVYKTALEKIRDFVHDAEQALDHIDAELEYLASEEPPEDSAATEATESAPPTSDVSEPVEAATTEPEPEQAPATEAAPPPAASAPETPAAS